MYNVISLFRKISDEDIWGSSAALSFYLLLSVFPFLIALVAMMAFVPVETEQLISVLNIILPKNVADVLNENSALLESGRMSVMSIGFISAIWVSSKGVKALMRSLNKSYQIFDKRSWIKQYAISIIVTIGLAAGIIISVFFWVLGFNLLEKLNLPDVLNTVVGYMRTVLLYVGMVVVMAFLFKFVPDKKLKFSRVIPGALTTGVIWVIATVAFGLYMDINGAFSNFYGTLGSVIALMIWLYLISFSILFGNAVNSFRLEWYKSE